MENCISLLLTSKQNITYVDVPLVSQINNHLEHLGNSFHIPSKSCDDSSPLKLLYWLVSKINKKSRIKGHVNSDSFRKHDFKNNTFQLG